MNKIPIKKGNLSAEQVSDDLKVDLRNSPEIEQKQPSQKWLFLSIILFLAVIVSGFGWWACSYQKPAFIDLVPENAVVFALVGQGAIYQQVFPFSQFLKQGNFYGQGAIVQISDYLKQADLDFQNDIQLLFKEQAAFILLPVNNDSPLPFLLIFEKKDSLAQISQILSKIEPKLKADYNFSFQIYRQIEITVLEPFFSPLSEYTYAQIDDYFIISNSQESLKMLIDTVISKY